VVKWSKPAKLDLKQIHDYIARDSKFYAQKVSIEIVEKSERLNSSPEVDRFIYLGTQPAAQKDTEEILKWGDGKCQKSLCA
jgi:hypothetical protein